MSVAGPERRKPGTSRVPFEALVEIAAPEGASFEAESIDLSASGMHLRTAYLPSVGTPLSFRFEPGEGSEAVEVAGEVVWCQDGAGGCEFGVRFADVAGRDADAIQRLVGATQVQAAATRPGSPVRIHIDGMAAPMRATLRADRSKDAVVGSELKMLRLGASVELEDKERGTRRAARVDGVACEVDPDTRVPQLVVRLRFDGEGDASLPVTSPEAFAPTRKVPMPADVETAAREIRTSTLTPPPAEGADTAEPESADVEAAPRAARASEQPRVALPVGKDAEAFGGAGHDPDAFGGAGDEEGAIDRTAGAMKDSLATFGTKMKGAFGGAAAVASRLGARVGTTVALLAKKKQDEKDEGDVARRTTTTFVGAPGKSRTLRPQGNAREALADAEDGGMQEIDPRKQARRRQAGIAFGIGLAVVLGFLAVRKPAAPPTVVQAPAPELAPPAAVAPVAPLPAESIAPVDPALAAAPVAPPALVGESTGLDAKGNPNPFGTPSVKKGTKMVLRLDGPIGEIKGMQMPNGFVVSVPNRKSLEAAGPLAAKDPRITSAKVVNQPGGAELTIAFKDGVSPSYAVRAKNDALVIVLQNEKAIAKKKSKGSAPAKAPHHKKKK